MTIASTLPDGSIQPGYTVDQPAGIGTVMDGGQDNAPVAASTGAGSTYNTSVMSGTQKNSQKGLEIWQWDKYAFMFNCYMEMGAFYNGTALRKSIAEYDDEYLERRATTHFRNFFRSIIDATYLPVFASGATRKTEYNGVLDEDGKRCPLWNSFLDNCDNRSHHLGRLTREVLKYSNMQGVTFVIVDNFPGTEELPLRTVLQNRLFPYIVLRHPEQVEPPLLKIDEFANIEEIAFREMPEWETNPKTNRKEMSPRWKLWTKTYSVKLKKKISYNVGGRQVEWVEIPNTKVTHNLGVVPVIPVISGDDLADTVLVHPRFYSIARCNLSLFTIDSYRMRLVRSQMFPIMVKPQTKDIGPDPTLAVGPLRGLDLPPDQDGVHYQMPQYISPPVGPYQELGETIKDIRDDLFRLAGQFVESGIRSSAAGKKLDFQAQEWVLRDSAKCAADFEERVSNLFKLYVKSEKFEYECHYEDNYHPLDASIDLKLYGDYIALEPGTKGKALALEQATRSVFDDLDDEDVQPVIEEIQKNAEEEEKTEKNVDKTGGLELSPEEAAAAVANLVGQGQVQPQKNAPPKRVTKAKKRGGFSLRTTMDHL